MSWMCPPRKVFPNNFLLVLHFRGDERQKLSSILVEAYPIDMDNLITCHDQTQNAKPRSQSGLAKMRDLVSEILVLFWRTRVGIRSVCELGNNSKKIEKILFLLESLEPCPIHLEAYRKIMVGCVFQIHNSDWFPNSRNSISRILNACNFLLWFVLNIIDFYATLFSHGSHKMREPASMRHLVSRMRALASEYRKDARSRIGCEI